MKTRKPGVRRPDDEYPSVKRGGYADEMRRRREEDERNAEIAREIAAARRADGTSMDELLKRMDDWSRGPRFWR